MGKDPSFLFYSKDWIDGTAEMLPAEKGVYIDLLAYQHQRGDLPNNIDRLARLVRLSKDEFLIIWDIIKDKFIVSGERIYNERLNEVMNERKEKAKTNKIIGLFSAFLRTNKPDKKTYNLLKNDFKVSDFEHIDNERLNERINEWCNNRLKSIEDVNVNEDNILLNKINIEFLFFWNLYDKKIGDKKKVENKWNSLKNEERQKIIDTLPNFLKTISDKQFQPYPETYLNNRRWEDEIQTTTTKKEYTLFCPEGSYKFQLTESELQEKKKNGYWKELNEV
jgi:uncharacterized protein YdaU (DUF1376 family)